MTISTAFRRSLLALACVGIAGCGGSQESDARPGTEDAGSSARGDASKDAAGGANDSATDVGLPPFSFFVTSLRALQELSNSAAGFGGDSRFGKTDGLSGADEICRQIAEGSMRGAGAKPWKAFLSATAGQDGGPVHAKDRVGEGPWFDRVGRVVARSLADLIQKRPSGADPAIADDLPNEEGLPNHAPDGLAPVDNHDMLTGTNAEGKLYGTDWGATCHDWTSAVGGDGRPRVGHSWPRDLSTLFGDAGFPFPFPGAGDSGSPFPFPFGPDSIGDFSTFDMVSWMSSLDEAGCAPGVGLVEMGPPNPQNPTVGSGGGYGGFYCFSTVP